MRGRAARQSQPQERERPVTPSADILAPTLLAWFERHGRRDLPWQLDPSPYRVWVSEVMLQQTQVATVRMYFERFMSRFPSVATLAAATLDEVLHPWTGLGYYARARNLHQAARIVVERYDGELPDDIEALQALPGIGRSTAGAILALSRSQRHPILDGNARRVLARYFGVEGHAGDAAMLKRLWALAEACTPDERVAAYTQAVMDLGATVCTRTRPRCDDCPLHTGCVACASGRQGELPARRPKRARPHRTAWAAVAARPDGAVLLEARPATGLWGGLHAFPMFDSEDGARDWLAATLDAATVTPVRLDAYEHAFTHFDLTLHPLLVQLEELDPPGAGHRWYNPRDPEPIGLAKPVVDILRAVCPPATNRVPS